MPEITYKGMPTTPITFASSAEIAGLELVDIYLWIFKRFIEKKELAPQLLRLVARQLNRGGTDEISINAMVSRWTKWFDKLPEPTEDQIKTAKEIVAIDEERRMRAVREQM